MPVSLNKNYKEASEVIQMYLKNVKVKKKTRKIGNDKQNIIEVYGDFKSFSIVDMDSWGGRLKFRFLDTEAKTEKAKKFRGEMAMNNPHVAGMFIGKTSMFVFRQVKREVYEDGKLVEETKAWKDFTREWITKLKKENLFNKERMI